jgi:hypothetical protein
VQGRTAATYSPDAPVTRAQMASLLVRAHRHRTDRQLPAATTTFDDLAAAAPHEESIGRAAGVGIAAGRTTTSYAPTDPVTREQMATFLARSLSLLTEEGHTRPRT